MSAEVGTNRGFGNRLFFCAIPLFVLSLALVFSPCWSAPTFFLHEQSILRLPVLSTWRNVPTIFTQEFMIFSDGIYRPLSYALVAVLRTHVPTSAVWF